MAPSLLSSVVFSPSLQHHWVVKIIILVFPGNIVLVLPTINEQFRSMTQSP